MLLFFTLVACGPKLPPVSEAGVRTEAELLACPNFGQTSLNEIKTKLDELGLALRG